MSHPLKLFYELLQIRVNPWSKILCHQCGKIISRRRRRTAQSLHTEHTEHTDFLDKRT